MHTSRCRSRNSPELPCLTCQVSVNVSIGNTDEPKYREVTYALFECSGLSSHEYDIDLELHRTVAATSPRNDPSLKSHMKTVKSKFIYDQGSLPLDDPTCQQARPMRVSVTSLPQERNLPKFRKHKNCQMRQKLAFVPRQRRALNVSFPSLLHPASLHSDISKMLRKAISALFPEKLSSPNSSFPKVVRVPVERLLAPYRWPSDDERVLVTLLHILFTAWFAGNRIEYYGDLLRSAIDFACQTAITLESKDDVLCFPPVPPRPSRVHRRTLLAEGKYMRHVHRRIRRA